MQKFNAMLTPLIALIALIGTGFLDGNGFVHYNPEANYFGATGFEYSLRAANDAMERRAAQ